MKKVKNKKKVNFSLWSINELYWFLRHSPFVCCLQSDRILGTENFFSFTTTATLAHKSKVIKFYRLCYDWNQSQLRCVKRAISRNLCTFVNLFKLCGAYEYMNDRKKFNVINVFFFHPEKKSSLNIKAVNREMGNSSLKSARAYLCKRGSEREI